MITSSVWPSDHLTSASTGLLHLTSSSLSKHLCFVFVKSNVSAPSESTRDSPSIGFLIAIVQRLEALLFLLLAEACGVRHFEEGRWKLHQPARIDGCHLPHVLLGSQHQLVVHNPADKKGRMLQDYLTVGNRQCLYIYKKKKGQSLWLLKVLKWVSIVPLRLAVKQSAGRMDVNHLLVYEGSVAFLRILFGSIPEETTADGFLDTHCGFATRHHI